MSAPVFVKNENEEIADVKTQVSLLEENLSRELGLLGRKQDEMERAIQELKEGQKNLLTENQNLKKIINGLREEKTKLKRKIEEEEDEKDTGKPNTKKKSKKDQKDSKQGDNKTARKTRALLAKSLNSKITVHDSGTSDDN